MTDQARRTRIMAVLAGTTLLAAGAIAGFSAAGAAYTPPPLSVPGVVKQAGFADLVAAVKPAVVNISTTQEVKPQQQQMSQLEENGPFGDMLKQFLGPNAQQLLQQQARPTHALGSGFLVDSAGYIVTNNHVIDDATEIQITLADGSMYPARVIGRDTKTDIALLKINATKQLPYVAFGDSDKERIGDWVIAVGNPYGLGGSVSAGIVSGSKRDINAGPYDDFLQVDAPINPGNSGGPLFDQSGQVIGIDTAIYSPSGGSVGIGFAIPSDVARRVVEQLREHGHVARGWLGVQMQVVTPALAKATGLDKREGVLVDLAMKDSPAARAGIVQGDVITSFNEIHIKNPQDLAFAVADTSAGQTVPITVWRNAHDITLKVTIGTERQPDAMADNDPGTAQGRLGLELAPLDSNQRQQLGLTGAVVQNVAPGSPADNSGIEPGDVIVGIGSHKVTSPGDAAAQIQAAENARQGDLALLIMRNGATEYVPLELGKG